VTFIVWEEQMKTLVVYYSLFGATKLVANELAAALGADLKKTNKMGLDITEYGLIIVGTPTWNGKPSWPVKNFLKRNDFSGKKLAFFCTKAGSDANLFPAMGDIASAKPISTKEFVQPRQNRETTLNSAREWAKTLK